MITYRQTVLEDIPALSGIFSLAIHNDNSAAPLFAINDPVSGWVACCDEKPIGAVLADRISREVCIVSVVEEHRGKGIARELMRQAEAWLFSHGWDEILVSWRHPGLNRPTSFFKRLGWQHSQSDLHPLGMFKKKDEYRINPGKFQDQSLWVMKSYHVFASPKPGVPIADFEGRIRLFMEDQLEGNCLQAYRILQFAPEGNFSELPNYQIICDYASDTDLSEAFAEMRTDRWKQGPHAEMMEMVGKFRVAFSEDVANSN